jgi:hypothetical protein
MTIYNYILYITFCFVTVGNGLTLVQKNNYRTNTGPQAGIPFLLEVKKSNNTSMQLFEQILDQGPVLRSTDE